MRMKRERSVGGCDGETWGALKRCGYLLRSQLLTDFRGRGEEVARGG